MYSNDSICTESEWEQFRQDGADAVQRIIPLVYMELRRRAELLMAAERASHTLQPTAVVHEVFLRLFKGAAIPWENSAHFLFAASREMRHILTGYARRRLCEKRGGQDSRVFLDDSQVQECSARRTEEALAIAEALDRLEQLDPRAAKVVELRFFTGLTAEETAAVMGLSDRSVRSLWNFARVWLRDQLRYRAANSSVDTTVRPGSAGVSAAPLAGAVIPRPASPR
jgi:RNA polymerase sigma factor (TIGR02999 family)